MLHSCCFCIVLLLVVEFKFDFSEIEFELNLFWSSIKKMQNLSPFSLAFGPARISLPLLPFLSAQPNPGAGPVSFLAHLAPSSLSPSPPGGPRPSGSSSSPGLNRTQHESGYSMRRRGLPWPARQGHPVPAPI